MKTRHWILTLTLVMLCTALLPETSFTKTDGTVPGKIRMTLYQSGTGSERGGINDIYASIGDTISIDIFIRNFSSVPVSLLEVYLTLSGACFNIASQGSNEEKNDYYKHFKPFIQGNYLKSAFGNVMTFGNNTWGDSLTADDNGFEDWQLNYVEITGPDVGFGRPVSRLRYGIVATFQLIAKAPCDSATIKLDTDHFHMRMSSYHDPNSNDGFLYQSFQTCYITVTGMEINPPIPDLLMAPGTTDTSIDLDEHVGISSIPDSLLIWNATGNNRIGVAIDPSTHGVTFTAPLGFKGFENITFTVSDGNGNFTSDTMRVTVDDPPRLIESAIPDTIRIHEDSLEVVLNLQQIVEDSDDEFGSLNWFFTTGGNVNPLKDDNLLYLAGVRDFYGLDEMRISVYDQFSLGDSLTVPVRVLPVNDPPVIEGLLDTTIERGSAYQFNIMNYAYDVDGDPLIITWDPVEHLDIFLEGTVVTIMGKPGYIGSEQVTFTVTDPSELADNDLMYVTITPAKNPPVWSRIPKVGFAQNEADSSLVIWDYVADSDDADNLLSFEITNDDDVDIWEVNGYNGKLYLYDIDDTPGWDRLTITATDPDGNMASTQFLVFIAPADGTPLVGGIPDTTLVAGDRVPFWIDLDDYYYDIDNTDNQMTWSWGRQAAADSSVTVTINPTTRMTGLRTLSTETYGINRIFFTATDPTGKFGDDLCIITVLEDLSKPYLDLPAKIGFVEGTKDSLDLDDFVDDPEYQRSELTWAWDGNTNTVITLDEPDAFRTRPVSFSGPAGWTGWERVEFVVSNPLGGAAEDTLTVFSVPDDGSPIAGGLLEIKLKAGECTYVNLEDYYFDADTPYWDMSWTVSGNDSITVSIDPITHLAHVCAPSESWEGRENLIFTVSDPENHTSAMNVLVTVTDAFIKNVFSVMIFRNPMQEDYMDLYIRSREDLSIKPTLDILAGDDSTRVKIEAVAKNYFYGRYLLGLDKSLGTTGAADVVVRGTTSTGKAVQDSAAFAYGRVGAGGAKFAVGQVTLDIPAGALAKQAVITVIPDSPDGVVHETPLQEVLLTDLQYRIGPGALTIEIPLTVGFSVHPGAIGAGVYHYQTSTGEWSFAGARTYGDKVEAETYTTGLFRLGFDATPPQARLLDTRDGVVRLFVADYGSGIDEQSISITVDDDGTGLPFLFEPEASEVLIQNTFMPEGGEIALRISVSDRTGNNKVESFTLNANAVPGEIALEQNFPNPFNPATYISFENTSDQKVSLEVYDLLGRKVRVVANDRFPAGRHTFVWDARDDKGNAVSSGIYLYKVISGTHTITRKMLLLR